MKVEQTNKFKKAYKKLHANQRAEVNAALHKIIADPDIGEQKKASLSWLRVYKYTVVRQLTLIGYTFDEGNIVLTFVAIGPYENFYRDLTG